MCENVLTTASFSTKGGKTMIGNIIVAQLGRFKALFRGFDTPSPPARLDLHTAWLHPERLPVVIQLSPVARRYLQLLGPLGWDRLPERNLQRNWGQPTIPYAAFIPACLLKLNEGQGSISDLRLYLSEHPELIDLFGFPRVISNPGRGKLTLSDHLPTARHLTQMLRTLPNATLQLLLADSVQLIRQALAEQGVPSGDCISLDTKHILAWVKENNPKQYVQDRFDKTRQPAGDPDCKVGCKRRHNRRKTGSAFSPTSTPTKNPIAAEDQTVGEFYWGYGSGIVVTKVPGWGEFVLAELTQTFDKGDTTYFFPLMTTTEQRLGFRPRWGTFDAAFDAWYVYAHFHRPDDPLAFAAVPFSEKAGCKVQDRHFNPEGLPLCAAGLPMPLKTRFTDRSRSFLPHERGKYACPLRFPNRAAQVCPTNHKTWAKGGCTADMPTSIGARLRYTLERDSQAYQAIYKQRTAVERINSQAKALRIERPYLRNGAAIANQNTLIYILINLRFLKRIRDHLPDPD
jgi:hypothetical protein